MASTINAQTTPFAAVVTTADNTGNLAFQTANVTAMTIDSSQVVTLANPLPAASGGTGTTSFPAPGSSGNVLTSNGTAWTSSTPPANNALSNSFPLKSGATLAAGRALNINGSGEVGDFPVVNTLGTLVENTTAQYNNNTGLSFFSTDGSRALIPVNENRASGGGFPYSVRGVAITSTTQTTGSPVSLSPSGGFNYYMWCKPINTTQFLIAYSTSSGTSGGDYGLTIYGYARVATVDASGNVTLGTAITWSQSGSTFAYGIDMTIYPLPSGRFALYTWIRFDNYNITYFSRTFSISGTTLTSSSDTDLDWFSDYQSFLTSGNKLVGAAGGALYYCNYDGTVTSSYGNSSLLTSSRSPTQAKSILVNANYGLVAYNKSNNDFVIETFSINQTTGVPTTTATYVIVGATTIAAVNMYFAILSSTGIILSYEIGTTSYALTLELDATAQVTGSGIPLITNTVGDDVFDIVKTGSNTVRYVYNNSSKGYTRDITINTYDTLDWVSMGASATSQNTSPASVIVSGVCSGFTSLTPGTIYYVNESTYDGQITATIGNYRVGTAISSTQILLG